jgi:hypothetical protein
MGKFRDFVAGKLPATKVRRGTELTITRSHCHRSFCDAVHAYGRESIPLAKKRCSRACHHYAR